MAVINPILLQIRFCVSPTVADRLVATKLSAPLRSRFRRLHLPKYHRDEFLEIAMKVCPKLPPETALIIGKEVWNQEGDIRDIISISKLVQKRDGPDEIAEIINTMRKYGDG